MHAGVLKLHNIIVCAYIQYTFSILGYWYLSTNCETLQQQDNDAKRAFSLQIKCDFILFRYGDPVLNARHNIFIY
jgi:hypothetical protein